MIVSIGPDIGLSFSILWSKVLLVFELLPDELVLVFVLWLTSELLLSLELDHELMLSLPELEGGLLATSVTAFIFGWGHHFFAVISISSQ